MVGGLLLGIGDHAVGEHLGVHAKGGEGRAEFVGDGGDETGAAGGEGDDAAEEDRDGGAGEEDGGPGDDEGDAVGRGEKERGTMEDRGWRRMEKGPGVRGWRRACAAACRRWRSVRG